MKKIFGILAVGMMILSSCGNSTPSADLKNKVDTLSYVMGMANTQGLEQYLIEALGVDSTCMDDVIKGIQDAVNAGDSKEKQAYYAGLQIGSQIKNQMFKGILDDEGVTKFYGGIVVAQDAQHTEAFQANHNLLISDTAKAYSKPQLEIYADDVKCSHGATVGRLNEDELFYMRSRGIPVEEAKLLQQKAFAFEVLQHITSEELRARMDSLVEKRLRGEFSKCRNCSKNCC